MATIAAHEFISLDGVFEIPTLDVRVRLRPEDGRDPRRDHRRRPTPSCLGARRTRCSRPPGASARSRTTRAHRSSTRPRSSSSGANEPGRGVGEHHPPGRLRRRGRSGSSRTSREGTIYISGSGQLVRGLIADGLLDELHLFVYPIALGTGDRLFGRPADQARAQVERRLRQRRRAPLLRTSRLTSARLRRPAASARRARSCAAGRPAAAGRSTSPSRRPTPCRWRSRCGRRASLRGRTTANSSWTPASKAWWATAWPASAA